MVETVRRVLLRLGKKKWMQALAEHGSILMQQLNYYTDLDNKAQGDPDEGLIVRYTAKNPTLKTVATLAGKRFPLPGATTVVHSPARNHGVLCLYGMETEEEHGQTIDYVFGAIAEDPQIAQFNHDSLVLIQNAEEFDRRLRQAATRAGHDLQLGLVEYMPSVYCGPMGPFRKLDRYSYQKEVRYLTTKPVPKNGLQLMLGPLDDIVVVFDMSRELARGKAKASVLIMP